jgi:hypothetical protein
MNNITITLMLLVTYSIIYGYIVISMVESYSPLIIPFIFLTALGGFIVRSFAVNS